MWKIKLDTTQTCDALVRICQKYSAKMDVDICYGRYLVDGCSILGVMSLMLHEVEICMSKTNEIIIKNFEKEIAGIGAWKEE